MQPLHRALCEQLQLSARRLARRGAGGACPGT